MYTQLNETLHLWGIDVIKLTPRSRSFRNSINLHSSSVLVFADCWLFSVRFFFSDIFLASFCAITKFETSSWYCWWYRAPSRIIDRGSRIEGREEKTFNFDDSRVSRENNVSGSFSWISEMSLLQDFSDEIQGAWESVWFARLSLLILRRRRSVFPHRLAI